mgnify:CR=1 FL=1
MRQVYRPIGDGLAEIVLPGYPGNTRRNERRLQASTDVIGLLRGWPAHDPLLVVGNHPLTAHLPTTMTFTDDEWVCFACGNAFADPNATCCDMGNLTDELRDEVIQILLARGISCEMDIPQSHS